MAYPQSYYRDPAEALTTCRREEDKAAQKAERKAIRAMYGCVKCARYDKGLRICGDGQDPNIGFINTAHWCSHWWSDESKCPAPEISR